MFARGSLAGFMAVSTTFLCGCGSDQADDGSPQVSAGAFPVGGSGQTAGTQATGGSTQAAGTLAAGGSAQAGGAAVSPAYERLDCDLPFVIGFCGGTTCHYQDAQDLGSGLPLVNRETQQIMDDVESRLMNLPATYNNVLSPAACPSVPELVVDPVDVEQSLILKKLMGTHTCGDEMPKFPAIEWGSTNNPGTQRDEFVACIRAWVTLLVEDYNQAP